MATYQQLRNKLKNMIEVSLNTALSENLDIFLSDIYDQLSRENQALMTKNLKLVPYLRINIDTTIKSPEPQEPGSHSIMPQGTRRKSKKVAYSRDGLNMDDYVKTRKIELEGKSCLLDRFGILYKDDSKNEICGEIRGDKIYWFYV